MRSFGLICFNVLLAVGAATVYAWLVRNDGNNADAWQRALAEGGSAGFLSGLIVGLGATLGPRPVLPTGKCIQAQIINAVTSLVFGLIAYTFPKLWTEMNIHLDEALRERGILKGSGIGLIVSTVWQFFEIYFKRRNPSR
ncbi:MAG TPA: hypothetical protein VE981_14115 [Planctomycetota bacterium]|nr:hypothetical protein [Planctomycetota bacterium]